MMILQYFTSKLEHWTVSEDKTTQREALVRPFIFSPNIYSPHVGFKCHVSISLL